MGRPNADFERPWIEIAEHELDFTPFRRWLTDVRLVELRFDDKSRAWNATGGDEEFGWM